VHSALFLLTVLLLGEAVLQVASLLVSDRSGHWRPGAAVKILCVGDSHTYGVKLPEEGTYPALLQNLLDERASGLYSVINLGVPGMSTTQVRNRLPHYVARYAPDVVLVWCGSNNAWNNAEVDARRGGWLERVDGLATRSRLYRLVRLALFNRSAERVAAPTRRDGLRQQARFEDWVQEGPREGATWTVRHGDMVERIETRRDASQAEESMDERAYEDYRAMIAYLRTAGIPAVFIGYPLGYHDAAATRAMRRATAGSGAHFVDSIVSLTRVPREERDWVDGHHPGSRIYLEIARDIVPIVTAPELGPSLRD
jgi:lysophospholipase L1-like esterase